MTTVDRTRETGPTGPTEPGPVPRSRSRSPGKSRRRSGVAGGRRARAFPYALLAPAVVTLAVVLGYPLYRLVVMSTQDFGLAQQFGAPPEFVGLGNFTEILGDPYFWEVLRRTVLFCAVNVVLTMALGTLVALLLGQLGSRMRTLVSTGLLLAWAIPPLTASVVWQWMFDTQYGLVNAVLTGLGGDFQGHGWLAEPLSFFFVATLIVVWMSVPFVAFTLHAGMTQIPASCWRRPPSTAPGRGSASGT